MSELEDWVATVESTLETGPVTDARLLLDLVREVAHGVDRPAGPLTAYIVGVAVGSGMALDQAVARARELVAAHG